MSAAKAIDRERDAPRRPPRGQKADLFKWVNDQQQLDMRTKFILKELAAFADADCCAWSKVEDLAYAANCSHRTVQYHLSALLEGGLLKPTGRTHRLENSTRSVPIYQLAPEVEGLGAPVGMGAKIAPIEPARDAPTGEAQAAPIAGPWVQSGDGMGATGLHPQMENNGEQTGAKAPSPGAREAAFARLEGAVPKGLLKYADRGVAFVAFGDLLDQGVSLERLISAARRMVADPAFKSRKFPPALEDWLGKGQWRGWDGDEAPASAPSLDGVGEVPPEIRAAFLAVSDAGKVGSYLAPCGYEHGPPARLLARTSMAFEWIKRQRQVLDAFALTVELKGRS